MHMAYQPLEEMLPRAQGGVYRLMRVASLRALEVSVTGVSLVSKLNTQKPATVALEEIRAGKVMDKETAEATDKAAKAKKKLDASKN